MLAAKTKFSSSSGILVKMYDYRLHRIFKLGKITGFVRQSKTLFFKILTNILNLRPETNLFQVNCANKNIGFF